MLKNFVKESFIKIPDIRKIYYIYLNLTILTEWYIKKILVNLIKKNSRDSLQILDAGMGFGQYSYFLSRISPKAKIIAVDSDDFKVNSFKKFIINENLNIESKKIDLESLEYYQKFNLILCTDVLEHIKNDDLVIKNFYKALKPEGVLIVVVPSWPQKRITPFLKNSNIIFPDRLGHFREGYSFEQITSLLKRNNFNIINLKFSFGKFGALAYEIFYLFQFKLNLFLLVFPFYLLFIYPFVFLLMIVDVLKINDYGNGIIVISKKYYHGN